MRVFVIFLFTIIPFNTVSAQDITGKWNGLLKLPNNPLNLVFHIQQDSSGLTGTVDSPDQHATGLPMTAVQFQDSLLHVEMTNLNVVYDGKLVKNRIEGFFKQNGMVIPLMLSREAVEKPALTRPQDPVQPYPYHSEDVKFENPKAGITLAGTLTLPQKTGKFPVVILISGSGPQDRNEELAGHRPFLVLADHLTKNGIGVLRYDDRGFGSSTGKFATATTPDFASDVNAAISYLLTRPEVNVKKIGLVGHSEGGIIAPMVAVENTNVAFMVLLGGPGIPGDEILIKQSWLIGKANGLPDSLLANGEKTNRKIYAAMKSKASDEEVRTSVKTIIEDVITRLPQSQQPPAEQRDLLISQKVNSVATPWFRYFVSYDPAPMLSKVKCPVLALNGGNDLQVPAKENIAAIRNALTKGDSKHFQVKELPGLNHLFQESKTGSPNEYNSIEQTFSPVALSEISDWILLQTKK